MEVHPENKLVRDRHLATARDILVDEQNPWTLESRGEDWIRQIQAETLASLLAFVEQCFQEAMDAVKRRLAIPGEFKGALAELVQLFALHPRNSPPRAELVPYDLEYDPGSGSPDIKIMLNGGKSIGVEVAHLEVKKPVNHSGGDHGSVEMRIEEPMHKLNAVLEGKVGSCRNCDVEVLALDLTEYIKKRVFVIGDVSSVTHHLENYLYGQLKVSFEVDRRNGRISNVHYIRDTSELPTVKGEDVEGFFLRWPHVGAVIYFWCRFDSAGSSERFMCNLYSRLALNTNPATPEDKRLPSDLASVLTNVMNECGPLLVSTGEHGISTEPDGECHA